jgi:class 3 adenylate cyclase
VSEQLAAFAPRRCISHGLLRGDSDAFTDEATTLFVDLAGFTPLTERLAGLGSRGTEQLSALLRRFFGSVTDVVLDLGGDPVSYGGDALTIVFDGRAGSTRAAALHSADVILELARRTAGSLTLAGPVTLQARIGIARGPVSTGLARAARRWLPVHLGAGLDMAVAAEEMAQAGHVVVHPSAEDRQPSSAAGGPPATFPIELDVEPTAASHLVHPLVLARLDVGAALLESHRTVTVAFIRFPPVHLEEMPAFLGVISDIVDIADSAGGEVVQVSGGDKGVVAMLLFGAPVAHDDDPLRTVQTLLEIRRRHHAIGIGVATGPVFSALLGSDRRRFAANSGPAVNLAARLMQAAGSGELLVEPRTWQASALHLRTRGRPALIRVKGFEGPVEVRAISGWRRGRARRASAVSSPIVGRDKELAEIERFLDGVSHGRGPTLRLDGEPGIGKTKLAREAADRATTRGDRVIAVDASSHPRGRATGLWRDLLAGLSQTPPTADRRQWVDVLTALFPDSLEQLPALGRLAGLKLPASDLTRDMPPDIEAELAQVLFARAVRRAAERQPQLIVVENAHHLDQGSLDVLAYVARTLSGAQAGILLTRRPLAEDESDPLAGVATVLNVSGLTESAAALLAADAWGQAGGGRAPAWLAKAVVQRAGGNPFFVRTVAQALWSTWEPGEPPPEAPFASSSLAGLLFERVDILPTRGKQFLNLLAVAGRPLASDIVEAQLFEPASIVQETARALVALDLVEVDMSGFVAVYRIRHDLLQQVVYESMSHVERVRLHRLLADHLAEAGADALEVADHVAHLDDPELSRRWFPLAAVSARASWAVNEAIRWWRCSLPLLDGQHRAEAEVELAELLLVGGRPHDVLELVTHRDPEPGNPILTARGLYAEAEAAFVCGELDRSETAATQVLRLTDHSDEIRHQHASELLVRVRSERGDIRGARDLAHVQLARAQAAGDSRAIATAHASLGMALLFGGLAAEAAPHYQAARVGAAVVGDVVMEVHVLSDLAGCCHALGDYTRCISLLAQAREAADEIGYRRHLSYNLTNEAQLRCTLGDEGTGACAALAVQRSLELDDPGTAADALQSWISTQTSPKASARSWKRLVGVDAALGRLAVAAAGSAELALAQARAGNCEPACAAADDADRMAADLDLPRVLRRSALARLLAHCPIKGAARTPANRDALLQGLAALADDEDLDDVDRAELAVERWRTTRAASDHEPALVALRAAFAMAPSARVRAWFKELGAPPPSNPLTLPPPIGIGRVRTTRAQLDNALSQVEAAVFGRALPPKRPTLTSL